MRVSLPAFKLWELIVKSESKTHITVYTLAEIQRAIGVNSKAGVERAINELEEAGLIADEEV